MTVNKKLIILLTSFLLIFSAISVGFAEDISQLPAETLIGVTDDIAQLEKYNELLVSMGILKSVYKDVGKFNEIVTRNDFIPVIMKLINIDSVLEPEKLYFVDVNKTTPQYKEIYFLSNFGFLNGINGMFKPTSPLDIKGVQKAFIKAGGNDIDIIDKSVAKYDIRAYEIGLMKGINAKQQEVTGGMLVRMLYNLLNSKYRQLSEISSIGNAQYSTTGTFMEQKLKVKKVTGLLTATKLSGLYSPETAKDGCIEIDGYVYYCDIDVVPYLGYNMDAYIDISEDDGKVIYIEQGKKNKEIRLTAKQIESIESNNILRYLQDEESDRFQKVVLDDNAIVINNKKYLGTIVNLTTQELLLKNEQGQRISGDLTLIDNNGDDVFDVIIRNEYSTLWVANSDNNERIYSDIDGNVVDLSEFSEILVYDGYTPTDIKSIKPNQVLSIAENVEQSFAVIHISKAQTEGILEAKQEGEYEISGQLYEIDNYLSELFLNGSVKEPYIGQEYVFYLNMYGEISAVQAKKDLYKYGYLLEMGVKSKLSDVVQVRIFNENGSFDILDLDKKNKVDGKSYTTTTIFSVAELFLNNALQHQLIKYRTDESGKIKEILTANKESAKTDINLQNVQWHSDKDFALNFTGSLRFKSYLFGTFGNKFFSKNVVWVIPNDVSDEDAFAVYNIADYFKNDQSYPLEIYDLNEYGKIGAIISRGASTSDTYTYGPAIVQKVSYGLDESGEMTKLVKVVENGVAKNVFYDSGKTLENVSVGDIMRYNINAKGNINSLTIDFQYSNDAQYFTNTSEDMNHTGTEKYLGFGQIMAMDKISRTIQFSTNGCKTSKVFIYGDRLPVYIFDVQQQKVTLSTSDSIYTVLSHGQEYAGKVLITARYFTVESITIYKN